MHWSFMQFCVAFLESYAAPVWYIIQTSFLILLVYRKAICFPYNNVSYLDFALTMINTYDSKSIAYLHTNTGYLLNPDIVYKTV